MPDTNVPTPEPKRNDGGDAIATALLLARELVDERRAAGRYDEDYDASILLVCDKLAALLAAVEPFISVGNALTAQSANDTSPWATAPDATPYGNQGLTFGDFRRLLRTERAK